MKFLLPEIFFDIGRKIINAELAFEFLDGIDEFFILGKAETFPFTAVEALRLRTTACAFIPEKNNPHAFEPHEFAQLFYDSAGKVDHTQLCTHRLCKLVRRAPVIVASSVVECVDDLLTFPPYKPYGKRKNNCKNHEHSFLKRLLLSGKSRRSQYFNRSTGEPDVGQIQFCLGKGNKNFDRNRRQYEYPQPRDNRILNIPPHSQIQVQQTVSCNRVKIRQRNGRKHSSHVAKICIDLAVCHVDEESNPGGDDQGDGRNPINDSG